ncbi:hypothetical protein [Sporosarcina sp. Te-1]|uniref:hypothetical protein n=1 Tax=Sporosarcina sp. Te-1 TaxID=2818390 RepID=UPI001AA006BC|nr:hypothetical protein [Sporosarcina sp. Te-1]QTD40610.1 hypothetical protein J3U78_17880 [Sporosarcina sp. Te-1]
MITDTYTPQQEQEFLSMLSGSVRVVKKRGERITIIEYQDERYVYQSESAARGGHHNGKRRKA